MKIYTGLISLVAATVLFTGCGDTKIDNTGQNNTVSGDVKGCVYENIAGSDGNPVVGATVEVGGATGTTGTDGCFSVKVSHTTVNPLNAGATADGLITYAGFEDTAIAAFDITHVVSGVMHDAGDLLLARDTTSPEDKGIVGLKYADNMLESGVDGKAKPFQLLLSEDVELLSTLDANTLVEVYDENGTELDLNVTATVTYDSKTKLLSVTTSEAIAAGNMAQILMPQDSIADDASNIIVSGTNNTGTMAYGDSLTDYIVFSVKVFKESTLAATAVATVSQLDEDTIVDGDAANTYDAGLTILTAANSTFKNVVKHDENAWNSDAISNFNNDNNSRIQDLLRAYTGGTDTVTSNVAKIKFTPTNANYYTVKAYDENNNSVAITDANDNINANTSVYGGTGIKVVVDNADDVELSFTIPGATSDDLRVKITPYTFDGLAGTAILATVKDNVAPSTALQYSYNTADGVVVAVAGGVTVTEEVYGGSGEISNSTEAEEDNTTITIGSPILNMTLNLLEDQNATLDPSGFNGGTFTALATDYNASEYTAWSAVKTRSFGIGFTEPVESVTPAATGYVVTSEVNSTSLSSAYNATANEEVVIVTTTDIFAMVNDNNGSKITLNVSDLAGNAATSSVVLNDLVAPYIVSEVNSTSITFSEDIIDNNVTTYNITLNDGANNCVISDANITGNVALIGHCAPTVSGTSINYSTVTDLNGNAQGDANNPTNHTFRVY